MYITGPKKFLSKRGILLTSGVDRFFHTTLTRRKKGVCFFHTTQHTNLLKYSKTHNTKHTLNKVFKKHTTQHTYKKKSKMHVWHGVTPYLTLGVVCFVCVFHTTQHTNLIKYSKTHNPKHTLNKVFKKHTTQHTSKKNLKCTCDTVSHHI